jgi:hypothetical protein
MVLENLKKFKERLTDIGFSSRVSNSEENTIIYISLKSKYSFDKFASLMTTIGDLTYTNFPQTSWSSSTNIERSDNGEFEMSLEFKKSTAYTGGTYYTPPKTTQTDYKLTKGPIYVPFSSIRSYIKEGYIKEEFTLLERGFFDSEIKKIDPDRSGPLEEYKGGLSWTVNKNATIYIDKYVGTEDGKSNIKYLFMWSKDAEYKYYVLFDKEEFSKISIPEFQKIRVSNSPTASTSQTVIPKVDKITYDIAKSSGEFGIISEIEKMAMTDKLKQMLVNSKSDLSIKGPNELNINDKKSLLWGLYSNRSVRTIEISKIRPMAQNNFKFYISIRDLRNGSEDIYSFYYINSLLRLSESLFK